MARLIGIRKLDYDLGCPPPCSRLDFASEGVECFNNPAFEADPEADGVLYPSIVPSNHYQNGDITNNNTLHNHNQRQEELSTDSGVQICVTIDCLPAGDSFLDRTSPDSGVHEEAQSEKDIQKKKSSRKKSWSASFRRQSIKEFVKDFKKEKLLAICLQIIIPFLIAGAGTCGAGIVLDHVSEWEVFVSVTELFILVPTLLGLKGNLEMTLASRVSTQANLGKLDTFRDKLQMSLGNMALIQCQATVMGLLAAAFAAGMSATKEGGFRADNALLLCASSLFTACTASLILGSITIAVVVVSHKCHINPDNVATPIAASLGDVTTLGILAAISSYLHNIKGNQLPSILIISIALILVPFWMFLTCKNVFVKQVLYSGWIPVIAALIITSCGGFVLELSVIQFKGFAIFQPVINGVAGNLVAVQASRISTFFHQHSEKPGSLPPDGSSLCVSPLQAFFGKCAHARTARILLVIVIPGHVLFGYAITFIKGGNTVLTPTFLPIYLMAAFIQVTVLLYIAQCLIHRLWYWKMDPDNWAIPLLTALGDLSGTVCLLAAFNIYYSI